MLRLRQAVLVARDLDAVVERLRAELGLGEPFRDPLVGHFGLRNAVMAAGDTFVEVVSPTEPDTAAGRYLDRRGGDGGYMVMFQLDDLGAARQRVSALGIRVVWEVDEPDITDVHLHPGDVGGAIVALDRADPPESWRWGGPAWTGGVPEHGPGDVTGITVQAGDAAAVARRWAEVLGRDLGEDATIGLDGGRVRFVEPRDDRGDGIVGVELAVAPEVARGGREVEIGGVRFELRPVAG